MPDPDHHNQPVETDYAPGQLKQIFEPVADQIEQVRQRISQLLRAPDLQIDQCLQAISERTGKMLRPALVLLTGRLFGSVTPVHVDMAAMVELTHMASLLHDDVIDSAHVRRGQSSVNALWGNTAAVLFGDYLLAQAFYLGTSLHLNGAAAILCQTAQTLCTGELRQNLQKGRSAMTEEDYYQIIEAKTAALFQCSCQLGAKASNASESDQQLLGEFGRELGLAFQITDDLLDILSTQHHMGKTLGTDLSQEKFTLPVIHWLNQDRQRHTELISELAGTENLPSLVNLMTSAGSIDYARQAAHQHIEAALNHLNSIKNIDRIDSLQSLSQFVIARIR